MRTFGIALAVAGVILAVWTLHRPSYLGTTKGTSHAG